MSANSFRWPLLGVSTVILGWLVVWAGPATSPSPAGDTPPPPRGTTLYASDPQHLWNRLHEALLVRVGPDGHTYGQDRFEPLLWLGSRHLLTGPSHDRAVQILNEFIDKQGEKLIADPLKRAVLQ